jgi:hypothetical protein
MSMTGTGQEKRALVRNAGTVGGTSVDLVAKIVVATLNHSFSTSQGRVTITSAGSDTIWVDWYIYRAGTYKLVTDSGGEPIAAEVMVQFNDLDGPDNERLFIPLCAPPVDFVRISKKSTLTREFGTVAGVPEVFSDIGDKQYLNQPVSGAEISYSTTSVFRMGRTARSNFIIRLDNPSYLQADSFDLKCSDFRDPAAKDDNLQAGSGSPAKLQILNNNGMNDPAGAFSVVTPVTGFTMASVNLVSPMGATGIVNDGDGDVMGFAVPGEGAWTYDELTGELTFVPQAGFLGSPKPIFYTFRNATGGVSNRAKVTTLYPQLKIVQIAVPPQLSMWAQRSPTRLPYPIRIPWTSQTSQYPASCRV